jgi:cysteine synthase A
VLGERAAGQALVGHHDHARPQNLLAGGLVQQHLSDVALPDGGVGRRLIPGLGTSVRPPQLDESYVDEVRWIEEADTIRTCHRLARRGLVFGGSTGTVVSGAISWLEEQDGRGRELTAVAIAPDLGERYLDTVYSPGWVERHYGGDVLGRAGLADSRLA